MLQWNGKAPIDIVQPYPSQLVEQHGGTKLENIDLYHDKSADDVWLMAQAKVTKNPEKIGYPTQKPEALLERIIKASSNPDSIVLDCFMGSGTNDGGCSKTRAKMDWLRYK